MRHPASGIHYLWLRVCKGSARCCAWFGSLSTGPAFRVSDKKNPRAVIRGYTERVIKVVNHPKAFYGEVVDYGCDWITGTAKGPESRRRLALLGKRVLDSETRAGNERKPWGMSGYDGVKSGGCQVGERGDSTIVRLSSGVAWENWLKVYQAADSFSRLDLQVTAKMDHEPKRVIASAYRHSLAFSRSHGGNPTVSVLKCSNGTATMYLGRRQSERFARVYDKGAESSLDEYQACVRWELELKGDLCLPALRAIASSRRPMFTMASIVVTHFRDRGCSLPMSWASDRALSAPRKRSDLERQLTWLESQVRPTVEHLISQGRLDQVLRALNLRHESSPGVKRAKVVRVNFRS